MEFPAEMLSTAVCCGLFSFSLQVYWWFLPFVMELSLYQWVALYSSLCLKNVLNS